MIDLNNDLLTGNAVPVGPGVPAFKTATAAPTPSPLTPLATDGAGIIGSAAQPAQPAQPAQAPYTAEQESADKALYAKWLNPTNVDWSKSASSPGIIGAAQQPAIIAPSATSIGTPKQWNVTPDQTVAGQMKSLIDPSNPYYQQWATTGAQDAAARGFTGNSSIRDSGILDSVMRNATPIATADAATNAKAAGYNADMPNQFALKNADLGSQMALAQLSSGTQKYMSDQSAATQLAVSKMSNASQQTISQLHDANAVLLQSNDAAKSAYGNYVAAVAQIDQQTTMDEAAKRAAIITQTQIFNNAIAGMKAATPGTADVTSPLDTGAPVGTNTAAGQVGGVDVSKMLQGIGL